MPCEAGREINLMVFNVSSYLGNFMHHFLTVREYKYTEMFLLIKLIRTRPSGLNWANKENFDDSCYGQ